MGPVSIVEYGETELGVPILFPLWPILPLFNLVAITMKYTEEGFV